MRFARKRFILESSYTGTFKWIHEGGIVRITGIINTWDKTLNLRASLIIMLETDSVTNGNNMLHNNRCKCNLFEFCDDFSDDSNKVRAYSYAYRKWVMFGTHCYLDFLFCHRSLSLDVWGTSIGEVRKGRTHKKMFSQICIFIIICALYESVSWKSPENTQTLRVVNLKTVRKFKEPFCVSWP